MLRLALILSLSACITRVVPQAPQAPAQPVAKLVSPAPSLVARFTAMPPTLLLGKCDPWGDDSMVCRPTETTVLWCTAPHDGKPRCELALDWTPPPAKPEPQPEPLKREPGTPTIARPAPKH